MQTRPKDTPDVPATAAGVNLNAQPQFTDTEWDDLEPIRVDARKVWLDIDPDDQ